MRYKISKTQTAAALLICLYAVSMLVLQHSLAGYPPYSSKDPGPSGIKAFYLLSGELGYQAQRLEDGLKPEEMGGQGLLVIIDRSPMSGKSKAGSELTKWVRNGGDLLLFAQRTTNLTDAFGLTVEGKEFQGPAKIQTSAFTKDVRQLNFSAGRYLRVKNSRPEIIAEGTDGPVALTFPFGQGRVVAFSDPSLLTNSQIPKLDHIVLLLNVLRVLQTQTIWFDETGGTVAAGSEKGLNFNGTHFIAGIQLTAAVLLLFVYWGRRFGRPLPLPDESKGTSDRYINTMANIFRQAKARDIALDNIYEAFWHNLTRSLGLPAGSEPSEVINLSRQRANLDSPGLQAIIKSAETLRSRGNSTEAEIFGLVHDMEIWRRENLKNARH